MTQALSAGRLVEEHDQRRGFSISPTGAPLTSAEVATGEFVVEDVGERPGVQVDVTLANGKTISFPIAPIVTIYR